MVLLSCPSSVWCCVFLFFSSFGVVLLLPPLVGGAALSLSLVGGAAFPLLLWDGGAYFSSFEASLLLLLWVVVPSAPPLNGGAFSTSFLVVLPSALHPLGWCVPFSKRSYIIYFNSKTKSNQAARTAPRQRRRRRSSTTAPEEEKHQPKKRVVVRFHPLSFFSLHSRPSLMWCCSLPLGGVAFCSLKLGGAVFLSSFGW